MQFRAGDGARKYTRVVGTPVSWCNLGCVEVDEFEVDEFSRPRACVRMQEMGGVGTPVCRR